MLFCIIANAQSQYYYYKGQKINLTVDRNYVNVIADRELLNSSATIQMLQQFNLELYNKEQIQDGMVKLKFKSTPDLQEYSRAMESLK